MRIYKRKFDWEEAQRRYKAGETQASIARDLGVSITAVGFAVSPRRKAKNRAYRREWQRKGTCKDCGTQRSYNPTHIRRGVDKGRCMACNLIHASTTARPTELQCVICKEWKPDVEFPRNRTKPGRRHHHTSCRKCCTISKASWRARNPEKVRAYEEARNLQRKLERAEAKQRHRFPFETQVSNSNSL